MHDVCCHDAETPAIYLKFTIGGISHWLVINAHFLENYKACYLQAFLQHAKVFASSSERRKWKIMSITSLHVFQTLKGWFLETKSCLQMGAFNSLWINSYSGWKSESKIWLFRPDWSAVYTDIRKKKKKTSGGIGQMDSHLKRDENLLLWCLCSVVNRCGKSMSSFSASVFACTRCGWVLVHLWDPAYR